MKAITIDQLWKACVEERKKGNGKKTILVASDEEGNSFHPMRYLFTPMSNEFKSLVYRYDGNKDNCIILG